MWYRNRLTQILIEREETNRLLYEENKDNWYLINYDCIDPDIAATFFQLNFDDDAKMFLNNSNIISNNLCLQLYYSFCSMFLSLFITKTSINGLLNRGYMHVFSRNQLKSFVGLPDDWSPIGKKILDIGAGDGSVTKTFAEFFSDVFVVEASKVMEWRLLQKGYKLIPINKWKYSKSYDLIVALNLIDRHFNPLEFLADLHMLAIESNCLVIISLVLPYNSYVEFNFLNKGNTKPVTSLNVNGYRFEDHVNTLVRNTFIPAGFEVIKWTKLPYLCVGDLSQSYYKLDDAVFLLKPMPKFQNVSQHAVQLNSYQKIEKEL